MSDSLARAKAAIAQYKIDLGLDARFDNEEFLEAEFRVLLAALEAALLRITTLETDRAEGIADKVALLKELDKANKDAGKAFCSWCGFVCMEPDRHKAISAMMDHVEKECPIHPARKLEEAISDVMRLREASIAVADDLTEVIKNEYGNIHPARQARHDRDMASVDDLRIVLSATAKYEKEVGK